MRLLLEPRPRDPSLSKTCEDEVVKELVPLFHGHSFDRLGHLPLLASFFFGFGGTNGRSLILRHSCYDLGSSLRKRNDLQGKDGSTSILQDLTNGVARADSEDNISRVGASGSKG